MKILFRDIVFAFIGLAIGVFLLFKLLGLYTQHGKSITVPDLSETSIEEVKSILKKKKLRYEVADTSYNETLPAGAVIDQNPKPNSQVKQKRTIYLVINSDTPPPVSMPDLVDTSVRQAEILLKNSGLRLGERTYRPDIAKDVVLEQLYKGQPIKAGDQILKGERVDVVLGDGFGKRTMQVPDLIGLEYQEAIVALQAYSLNPGKVVFDGNSTERADAIVIDQSPSSSSGKILNMGESIDIYLTPNPES
ncbi:MAG: PASTA domain-containing protein [Saprospiraceae bacterium]|nr:PASTA domain-containing protein [Saprospiraceae bacterium]